MIFRVAHYCNAPAVGSYHVTFGHGVFAVVSPFRVNVRLEREQQFFNCRLVKNSDISHRLQRIHQLCAFESRHDRTPGSLQPFDLRVGIHPDDEQLAELEAWDMAFAAERLKEARYAFSDQEVKDFYEENKANFGSPASRAVRHILIACDKPAACRKAKKEADDIYRQIRAGGDFAKLAKKYSDDSSSAAQGGKFTAEKGATVKPFDRAVFALKTGGLSKPVRTEFGWHIIEAVAAIKPESTRPLSEVEKDIRDQLLKQKQNDAMNKWVAGLKKRLADEIAYAPGFRPAPTTSTGATTTG